MTMHDNVTLHVVLITTKPKTNENEANILVKIGLPSVHSAQFIIHDISQIASHK